MIEEVYGSIPQIVHVYRTFPLGVLRADMFRYLVLFAYGGKYLERIDVFTNKRYIR